MARPAKSIKVKSGAIASDAAEKRLKTEEKLRGSSELPKPPNHLSQDQKKIFKTITNGMAEADVLGKLDVYVLESTAIAISRLRQINGMIDDNPRLLSDTAIQGARAKYQADMWRGCSELCLSPQARAKLGNIAAQAAKAKEDPLVKALSLDD